MLFLTVLILSTGLAYKDYLKSGLEESTKFDATIYNFKYKDSKHTMEEELKKMNFDFSKVEKYVFFNRYKINSDLDSKIGERLERDSLVYFKNYLSAISVSDFNNIRKLKGENPVKLQKNNVIITSDSLYIKNQLDKLLEKKEEVEINNIMYHI